jgi:hypothetical protein
MKEIGDEVFPHRTWSQRRVIITKKVIIFAKADDAAEDAEEVPLDAIPLFQIEGIHLHDKSGAKLDQGHRRRSDIQADTDPDAIREMEAKPVAFEAKENSERSGSFKDRNRFSFRISNTNDSKKSLVDQEQPLLKDSQYRNTIEIRTDIDGYNSGRVYLLRASSEEVSAQIVGLLLDFAARSRRQHETRTQLQRLQERCRRVYQSGPAQGLVALLIISVGTEHYFQQQSFVDFRIPSAN